MKTLLKIAVVLFLALPVHATDIFFNLVDFSANPATNRIVFVQSFSTPTFNSSGLMLTAKLQYVTDANGMFTITNAASNLLYQIQVTAPPQMTTFLIWSDPRIYTNTTYDGKLLLVASSTSTFPAGQVAWSAAYSDFRYVSSSNSVPNGYGVIATNGSYFWGPLAGAGTVTSVGLSMPPWLDITGSPVTGSGTLTGKVNTLPAAFGSVVSTNGFQLKLSPTSGFVLTSDASGNGTWQASQGGGGSSSLFDPTQFGTNQATSQVQLTNGLKGTNFFITSLTLTNAGTQTVTLNMNGDTTIGGLDQSIIASPAGEILNGTLFAANVGHDISTSRNINVNGTMTANSVVLSTPLAIQYGGTASSTARSSGANIGIIQASPASGNDVYADMDANTANFPQQPMITVGSSLNNQAIWFNNTANGNSNNWRSTTISFPGNFNIVGNNLWSDTASMVHNASGTDGQTQFFEQFGSNQSSIEAAYVNGNTNGALVQPQWDFINGNPWTSAGGVMENQAFTNHIHGSFVGTNSDGIAIYVSQFGQQQLVISDAYRVGEPNQAPSFQIELSSDNGLVKYISANGSRGSDSVAGQEPQFVIDTTGGTGASTGSSFNNPFAGFPLQIGNVWATSNILFLYAFEVKEGTGEVDFTNGSAFASNITMVSGSKFLMTLPSGDNALPFNVNDYGQFTCGPGGSAMLAVDGSGLRRFAIAQKQGVNAGVYAATGNPWFAGHMGLSDFKNLTNTTPVTNELTIDSTGIVNILKGESNASYLTVGGPVTNQSTTVLQGNTIEQGGITVFHQVGINPNVNNVALQAAQNSANGTLDIAQWYSNDFSTVLSGVHSNGTTFGTNITAATGWAIDKIGNGFFSGGIGALGIIGAVELDAPTAKLNNITVTNGAHNGWVLTSDSVGGGTWQPVGTGSFWGLTGNAGTTPSVNFIGTTDNEPLNIDVNSALQMQFTGAGASNIGYLSVTGPVTNQSSLRNIGSAQFLGNVVVTNLVATNVSSSSIAGFDASRQLTNITLGTGLSLVANTLNAASSGWALTGNTVGSSGSFIGTLDAHAFVLEANSHVAVNINEISAADMPEFTITGDSITLANSIDDTTSGPGFGNSILGGSLNKIFSITQNNTLAGGFGNTILTSASNSFIGGGWSNSVNGLGAAFILGGDNNQADKQGFALGSHAIATQGHSFVWSDGTVFYDTNANVFLIHSSGGVGINTNNPSGYGLFTFGSVTNVGSNGIGGNLVVTGNQTNAGNITTAGLFTGNGAGLTNISANGLASSVNVSATSQVTNYTVNMSGSNNVYQTGQSGDACFNLFTNGPNSQSWVFYGPENILWPTNCPILFNNTNNLLLRGTNNMFTKTAGSVFWITFTGLTNFNSAPNPNLTNILVTWGDSLTGAGTVNSLVVGAPTNTPSFTLITTNFIGGFIYTNLTGRPISVEGEVFITETGVAGAANQSLEVTNLITNMFAETTLLTSLAVSKTNYVHAYVPPAFTYSFTNRSSGAGDLSGVIHGQIMVN